LKSVVASAQASVPILPFLDVDVGKVDGELELSRTTDLEKTD
jgi:hypothetical protein